MESFNFKEYVSFPRWISYYEQISTLIELNPNNILEIGLGSKIFYLVIKELGFNIIGFDNNLELKPDVLGEIRNIGDFFQENQFDYICCFQVLEHIPFDEFELTIKNIAKTTSRYAVISLPFAGYSFGFQFRICRVGQRVSDFIFRIPHFWYKHSYDGKHYWEVGKKGYPLKKIKKILLENFKIIKKNLLSQIMQ